MVKEQNQNVDKYDIPVWRKYTLSVQEAAKYFHIGDKKLRKLIDENPDAEFIEQVDELTDEFMNMGKASTGSNVGTGGMNTKMIAAKIATSSDVDMLIANSRDIGVLHRLLEGENEGTLFVAHRDESFDLPEFVQNLHKN